MSAIKSPPNTIRIIKHYELLFDYIMCRVVSGFRFHQYLFYKYMNTCAIFFLVWWPWPSYEWEYDAIIMNIMSHIKEAHLVSVCRGTCTTISLIYFRIFRIKYYNLEKVFSVASSFGATKSGDFMYYVAMFIKTIFNRKEKFN